MTKTDYLMLLPIVFNVMLMVGYLYEMNLLKAMYFFGAFTINLSIFWMR